MTKHEAKAGQNSFEDYMNKSPRGKVQFMPGQMIESQIVAISNDTIFLELNGKSEGVLDRAELLDKNGELTVKEGDTIKAFFLNAQNGELRFTTRISSDKVDTAILEEAYKNKIPVEGLVEKEIKGGYEVKIGEVRAFCPYSQMGLKRGDEETNWVGKHLTFIIQEYKDNGRNLIVSHRAIEEALQQEKLAKLKETLKEHSIVTGTIKSIQDFGAFVDLGGIQGLIPVSEISRERVEDINKVLKTGQEIRAEIIKLDWNTEKVTLSIKSLQEDPWDRAAEKYPEGSRHTGKVVRITDYGAFVSLEPGLDGLIHVSELRGTGPYNNVKDAVKIGQTLTVQVLEVDPERRRIALKPAGTAEEEVVSKKYMTEGDTGDTYNPFAALLKKK